MTRRRTTWLAVYAALAAAMMLAAVVIHRPEPAALAAPLLLLAAVAAAGSAPPAVEARIAVEPLRCVEGDTVTAAAVVTADGAAGWVEVALPPVEGLEPCGAAARVVRLRPGRPVELTFPLRCVRFGGYAVGPLQITVRTVAGLYAGRVTAGEPSPLRVYPPGGRLRPAPLPRFTAPSVGSTVARAKGAGIEFADIRPYVPGDRARDVNWRVTARRGRLHVNEHHPERNSDVVVFLDSFGDPGGWRAPLVETGVAAAAALVQAYLDRRDRVGLVGFGGVLRWVLPGSGRGQLLRLMDTLIDTRVAASYAWRDLDVIPARMLPPRALVVAVSPLLDGRSTSALADLRGRGFDLAVIDVGPERFLASRRGQLPELAERLWRMQRECLRAELAARGVAVAVWDERGSLASAAAELYEVRRWARAASR